MKKFTVIVTALSIASVAIIAFETKMKIYLKKEETLIREASHIRRRSRFLIKEAKNYLDESTRFYDNYKNKLSVEEFEKFNLISDKMKKELENFMKKSLDYYLKKEIDKLESLNLKFRYELDNYIRETTTSVSI